LSGDDARTVSCDAWRVAASKTRPRRARREQERALRKTVRQVQRLAGDLPGGGPERAIEVASASVVELKALGTPCLQCGGELELRHDRASADSGGVLRALELTCRRCHAPRTLWFRVVASGPN
jgi:hypothetical protein